MEYLAKEKKQEVFAANSLQEKGTDTGSPESQIALFTYRIAHLTEHLRSNQKDTSSRRGLLNLVGRRKKMLSYLAKIDILRYRAIIKKLNIRK